MVDYSGLSSNAFLKCETWLSGPEFLKQPEHKWPDLPDELTLISTDNHANPEVKKEKISVNTTVKLELEATSKLVH